LHSVSLCTTCASGLAANKKQGAMKKFSFYSILFLGAFFFAHTSHADYEQARSNGNFRAITPATSATNGFFQGSTSTDVSLSGDSGRVGFFASSSASTTLSGLVAVSQVGVLVLNTTSASVNTNMDVQCIDGAGTHTGTSKTQVVPVSGDFVSVNLTWATPVPCNASTLVALYIGWNNGYAVGGGNTELQVAGTNDAAVMSPGIGIGTISNVARYDYEVVIKINGLLQGTLPGPSGSSVGTYFNTTCSPTNFSVFGADFGQGACTLTKFLFVPD